jgi:hypothetical protein
VSDIPVSDHWRNGLIIYASLSCDRMFIGQLPANHELMAAINSLEQSQQSQITEHFAFPVLRLSCPTVFSQTVAVTGQIVILGLDVMDRM